MQHIVIRYTLPLLATVMLSVIEPSTAPAAETSTQGWTPRRMIEFKSPGNTALSPDGRLVAYTVSEAQTGEGKSSYLTHIWIVSADGASNRRITSGESSCSNPAFSPDGAYLSYTTRQSGTNQVWIVPAGGGEAEQATEAETGAGTYRWSPDSKRIAYLMTDPESDEARQAEKDKRDWTVRDTGYRYDHIYAVTLEKNTDGSRTTQRITSGAFHAESFDWSPDLTTIVFSHRKTPSANDWTETDISTVEIETGRITPLVTRPGADRYPKYSPDGQWIAFPSDFDDPGWALLSDAYIVPAKGGEPRKLAETPDRNFMYYGIFFGWSHDGKELYVQEANRTNWRVFAIPVDGGKPRMVTPGPGDVGGVSFDKTGMMSFVHDTCDTPPDVYVCGTRKFTPVKLTDVNAGYYSFPLGKTDTITWQSKDGREIEGLLTYPVSYQKGRQYPFILYIHGGPANLHTESYTAEANKYPIQAFAQAGYAVLRVNPRGSSGYGRDFRFANKNDWGEGDFDDQMTGVDTVIKMGVAHPDSLCVTGWSYGGYMTAATVTKTNRFKAAVMGAGISNLASFTGTADIPGFIPDYFGGEPWNKTETYLRHSPVFHADGVRTPTLILHGSLDRRVPLSQGEEFYNALRRQGCPTELVVYPRSFHSPSEPEFVVDIGGRIIGWFDTYLGRQ